MTGDYAKRGEAETRILRVIDTEGWSYLFQESGLRTLMGTTARDIWAKQIAEGEVSELTAANIKVVFGQPYEVRGDMLERGALQCFR